MTFADIDDGKGYFTYRSFRDDPSGQPNDILFGEGELFLQFEDDGAVTGTLSFPVTPGADTKAFMDLEGRVTSIEPLSLHFLGTGRAGTAIADFVYEYDCRMAAEWDTATPPQRMALVGTVRRNQDHGSAKAGVTASFISVKRNFVEPRDIDGVKLIPAAIAMLSDRVHRLRHTAWHTLRSDWHSSKMTDADRAELKKLGWGLNDPPFKPVGGLDLTNGAGEDFLYMHRRMIAMLHEVYRATNASPPAPWKQLPPANAPQFAYKAVLAPNGGTQYVLDPASSGFMVPPPTEAFMAQVGSGAFFRFNKTTRGLTNLMANMATNLTNERVVGQLTLGAYGNLLEFTVHNWMHMRWASLSRDPATGEPAVRDDYDIDTRWDDPSHDYLGDFHSSHVNPIFWKLHGWIDDRIEAWFTTHERLRPGAVKRKSVRGIEWFEPGPWVSKADPFDWPGAGHQHHHPDPALELETLKAVMAKLKQVNDRPSAAASFPTPRLSGFARHVL